MRKYSIVCTIQKKSFNSLSSLPLALHKFRKLSRLHRLRFLAISCLRIFWPWSCHLIIYVPAVPAYFSFLFRNSCRSKKKIPPFAASSVPHGGLEDIAQAERRVSFAPSHPRLEDPEREWKFVTCMN